jgi:hypothetical protein
MNCVSDVVGKIMWRAAASVALLLCTASAASADGALQADTGPGPFARGTVGIELGCGLLGEAWNLNRGREWLADGRLSVWWAFLNRASLVVEVHAIPVFQRPSRDAFVTGITPSVRLQILRMERADLFSEIGAGPSWSDIVVPQGGTRFNYLGHAGLGLSRRVGRQVHAVAGFRWIHLSNNGREGHDRNPDIQALGGYAAVSVGF